LRADNADQRLTEIGMEIGCVGQVRRDLHRAKMAALAAARNRARSLTVTPGEADRFGFTLNRDGQRRTAFELLSYPAIGFAEVARIWPELLGLAPAVAAQLEIDAKYAVYLDRQAAEVAAFKRDEAVEIPAWIDYELVPGLSNEARQKLSAVRPRTIGQASRLDGITPAALVLLAASVRRGHFPRLAGERDRG
jgi:tRNA uridine 5-carboxymethylaminomethyl modification enzyme